ncbi:hypothetical protein NPIL_182401 [Nephila pilipes]|uniref:Uncharacterized protein n=1 Tax=Nephila pilipes TaxID=299642 RepID=A0A8X6M6Y4_NEPPI|nr:hypothetical protein NPIL_182401 [Nephila pilipes]
MHLSQRIFWYIVLAVGLRDAVSDKIKSGDGVSKSTVWHYDLDSEFDQILEDKIKDHNIYEVETSLISASNGNQFFVNRSTDENEFGVFNNEEPENKNISNTYLTLDNITLSTDEYGGNESSTNAFATAKQTISNSQNHVSNLKVARNATNNSSLATMQNASKFFQGIKVPAAGNTLKNKRNRYNTISVSETTDMATKSRSLITSKQFIPNNSTIISNSTSTAKSSTKGIGNSTSLTNNYTANAIILTSTSTTNYYTTVKNTSTTIISQTTMSPTKGKETTTTATTNGTVHISSTSTPTFTSSQTFSTPISISTIITCITPTTEKPPIPNDIVTVIVVCIFVAVAALVIAFFLLSKWKCKWSDDDEESLTGFIF